MSNIPVHVILREFKHPAWTPVSVDGTAITSASADDYQALGTGSADKVVGGNTFKGDAGQMFTLSGYNVAAKYEDHTGDGDAFTQMRGVRHKTPGQRTLSCVVPKAWVWLPAMLHTIFNDAEERPMTIRDTYATGVTLEQEFGISNLSHPIAGKDVLKIEGELTPITGATETGLA